MPELIGSETINGVVIYTVAVEKTVTEEQKVSEEDLIARKTKLEQKKADRESEVESIDAELAQINSLLSVIQN